MKYTKIIVLTIILSLLFSMSAMANETEVVTTEDIAVLLGQMNLISGDGDGYKLEEQLTRAEASTFVVKLLGKESKVLENKAMYIKSNFPDIKGDEWFAPYVGFCERGYILTGFPDGTIKANAPLSEKAFLTMVLKGMGYTSSDFTWNDVYAFSYDKGLVLEEEYMIKVKDNLEYTRADAVKVMYNALKLTKSDDTTSFLDDLLNNEVVTLKFLVENKLVGEEKKEVEVPVVMSSINIEDIEIISEKELTITLNEEIKISESNVKIYRKDNPSSLLMVKGFYVDKNVIRIKSIDSTMEQTFILELNDLTDDAGHAIDQITQEFKGIEDSRTEDDIFYISSLKRVSDTELAVYFNQTLTSGAWISVFYSIYLDDELFVNGDGTDISVSFIDDSKTSILIKLNNHKFDDDKVYEFRTIKGYTSSSGLLLEIEKFNKFIF